VKSENYHIVLDKSGPSLNGVPLVLFAKDEYDFTSDVLAALNKSKGKEDSAPSKSAEPAPSKKK
jgi:hypothetical protein